MTTTPTLFLGEQQANTVDSGAGGDDQLGQQIVGLADGTFVVLWESNTDVGAGADVGTDIIGQRYDAEGNKIGGEFQANGTFQVDDEGDFTAAALPNGGFVIAYEDTDANGTSIRYEVKNASGGAVSSGTIASDPGDPDLGGPSITVNSDGSFLVAYQSRDIAADQTDTFATIVDSAGVAGSPFKLLDGSLSEDVGAGGQDVDTATLTNGNYVVVARSVGADDGLYMRIVSSTGANVLGFTAVANTKTNGDVDNGPTVTALAGGGFVVAWQNTDANDIDIAFQVYSAAGVAVGGVQFGVNSGSTDRDTAPEVIGLPDGGFVIALDDDQAGQIKLQRFNATGGLVGTEVIAGNVSSFGGRPTVTLSDDGRLLVGWTTTVLTGGFDIDSDVEFSILDPRENVINGDNTGETTTSRLDGATVNGLGGNDTLLGQGAADTLNGGAGSDTLLGRGGNDTFEVLAGEVGGDVISGGADNDRILANASVNLNNATLSSIEEIEFGNADLTPKIVSVDASQIGAGLAADLLIDGNDQDVADTLRVLMGSDTNLNLSAFTFQDFDTTAPENDRVLVIGDGDDETIIGSSVRDDVNGNGGDDVLAGGGGVDVLRGGLGDDTYVVNAAGEAIEAAGQGTDTVRAGVSYTLGANLERLQLTGGANINGVGNTGDNRLTGNGGDNALNGLQGDDLLTGGAGADRFLFTTALNAATNVDVITDFQVGVDELRLDNAVFAGLPAGPLAAGAFRVGGAAADGNDRIIYNNATGAVFFDADGAGGAAQTLFARLDPGLALTAGDVFVF